MPLTDHQRRRYRRNIDVPGMGEHGQERLLNARVVVIGAGGLGSATLPYLAAAGVGHITVVDGDVVEEMNLQRQVLHRDLGANKARSAAETLTRLNPGVEVTPVEKFLTSELAAQLFPTADLVLDCTEQFWA